MVIKPRHHPGPWYAGNTADGRIGVWTREGSYSVLDRTAPGINAEANATLIAAAPELLAALEDAEAKLAMLLDRPSAAKGMGDYFAGVQATWARARTAIAKATGSAS